MITELLHTWNNLAWVGSNILIGYVSIMIVVFATAYYILFDPTSTTGGRYIFRFFLSLMAIIGLVFVSVYVDPVMGRSWYEYPGDVLSWRPTVRLVGYGYVAYTITSLAYLLAIRKWWPNKLRTARDLELVKTRKLD